MLRPFLVVGIGGSGGKTVRAARQALKYKLDQHGWDGGWPEAWQLLQIDSPTTPDGLEFPAPLLPQEDYLSLVPSGVGYKVVHDKIIQGLGTKQSQEVSRSLPSPAEVKVPIQLGAGAFRAVGRTIAAAAMKDIYAKVQDSLNRMTSGTADSELKELSRLFGAQVVGSPDPTVIIISSVAGGSGAGMFIDVAEAIKAAIGSEPWAHNSFSLLFAPDVFAGLGQSRLAAMVPNSMGALAELVSGFWRNTPTEGTLAMYKRHGLNVPQSPKAKLGPAYNYIIGRKNSKVSFGDQADLYKALSNSLAAWMTDVKIQDDLSAYAVANFDNTSGQTKDFSNLRNVGGGLPLSSFGFARVSLGTDKFFEYAAERMAKQTLKTLLSQHTSTDPDLKEKKEDQWVEHFTNLNEGAFISDSGLDELTEANNQVIEALAPDTTELQTRLKSAISSAVSSGMPKGGHSFEKWVALITNAFEVNLPGLLDDLSKARHEKGRAWVERMPAHVIALVSKTMSQQGLAVTSKLVDRLIQQVRAAADELLQERSNHLRDASQISHTVSQAMGPASSMNAIPTNHPTVANALHQAELAFFWAAMGDLKQSASELMVDFADNFLEPLAMTLSRGFVALRNSTSDPKLPDNTQNPYAGWPDFTQKSVDSHFLPAPNESMLIDIKDFPAEFDSLVEQTVNDPSVTAARIVIDEVLMGSKSEEVAKLQEKQQWNVLELKQIWIPKNRHYQLRQAANQQAAFSLVTDHMQYLEFAKKWIKVPGRAFRAFMDQTIPSYLNAGGNQALQSERSKRFLGALNVALQSSGPLVDIDATLLAATHEKVGVSARCSGIPIDRSDKMRAAIDTLLVDNGHDPKSGWYTDDAGKAATTKSIEIVSQMESSMSPIPFASLMDPILQEWSRASSDFQSRSTFMTWRRGRGLAEAIPAHPLQWQTMLTGWFIARLLNLLENDKSDPSYKEKGPRVSIWSSPAEGMVDFPFPLHSAHITTNVDDFPAVVLDSLVVAMANCHAAASLHPLAGYQKLLELGGFEGSFDTLSDWILFGRTGQGSPTPKAERAGTAEMSPRERQDACAGYLEELLTKFREKMAGLDSHADSRTYPISWELRGEIEYALDAGIKAVRSIEPEEEL